MLRQTDKTVAGAALNGCLRQTALQKAIASPVSFYNEEKQIRVGRKHKRAVRMNMAGGHERFSRHPQGTTVPWLTITVIAIQSIIISH